MPTDSFSRYTSVVSARLRCTARERVRAAGLCCGAVVRAVFLVCVVVRGMCFPCWLSCWWLVATTSVRDNTQHCHNTHHTAQRAATAHKRNAQHRGTRVRISVCCALAHIGHSPWQSYELRSISICRPQLHTPATRVTVCVWWPCCLLWLLAHLYIFCAKARSFLTHTLRRAL